MAKLSFIPNKVVVWLGLFFVGTLFFTLHRLLLLLLHLELINKSTIGDILYSFWLGFKYDSMVLSYLILPLFLISLLPFIDFSKKGWRRVFFFIIGLVFLIIFFGCTADLGYLDHFGSRMNYWVIEYLDNPWLFVYSLYVSGSFWLIIMVWLSISIAFFIMLGFTVKRLNKPRKSINVYAKIIYYILTVLLLGIGIRGGISKEDFTWSDAFFCNNHFVNRLSLNSMYSLIHHSCEDYHNRHTHTDDTHQRYLFYNNNDACRTTVDLLGLNNKTVDDDFTLAYNTTGENSIGFLPNIVVVIMESWTAKRIGALGSKLKLTPEFDKLCSHGISFDHFYANGIRTNRGIPAVLCSFPSTPGRSIMKRDIDNYPFRSLAEVLKKYDYTSIFTYAGDINFDNMGNFLKTVGYDKFYDKNNFYKKDRLSEWGVADHLMFARMVKEIKKFPRPFNLSIMTMSNHEPFLIPDDRFKLYDDTIPKSNILNVFYYSDWAIGKFISNLRQYPVFDSTIFIFTADHCPHQSAKYPLDPRNFHIPLLIYAPGIIGENPSVIDKTCSQVDILPTLIGMTGLETELYSWGRDLLSLPDNDSGFAIVTSEEKLGMIEGSKLYFNWVGVGEELYDMNDRPYLEINLIDSLPTLANRMEKQLNSYIQIANDLAKIVKR